MIEELHRLLEAHAHLRGFPQFKNLRSWVEARLGELEDKLRPKATPSAQTYDLSPDDEVERRI